MLNHAAHGRAGGNPSYLLSLALLVAFGAAESMWFYFDHILGPQQVINEASHSRPRGNLSDLYPRWLGTRELLLHHRDPYSSEVTREIQMGYYGRALDASRPGDPKDQMGFAYPIYVTFLLAPTVNLPFGTVQRIFLALSFLLTASTALLWLYIIRWRPGLRVSLIFLLISISNIAAIQGLKLQQISLSVAALLALSLAATVRDRLIPAGFLLALATIKPQLTLIPVIWLFLWTWSDWRIRQRLVWAFLTTLTILLLASEAVSPGWLGRFVVAVREYRQYTQTESMLSLVSSSIFSTAWPAHVVTALVVLIALRLCFPLLKYPAGSTQFGECAALVMVLNIVVIPSFALYNQVLLIPTVMLLAFHARFLWRSRPSLRMTFGVTVSLFLWPWLVCTLLAVASPFLRPTALRRAWELPFQTAFTLPPFLFGLTAVLLYQHMRQDTGTQVQIETPDGNT